ncbi:hypothetical protein [Embleya sp. MST-111070]|uniref:hypothetical protein n=1 Tax=Embleya sp. MST-111070 TaxID=3398231 RepID=UPI003F736D28
MHADRERRSLRTRFLTAGGVFATLQTLLVLGATRVWADPTPGATASPGASPGASTSPSAPASKPECDLLTGPAKDICNNGGPGAPGSGPLGTVTDPLGSIAKGCADAATWIIDKLAGAVNDTTQVDFTNPGFLRQYAVVFAASTFLTLILWILAVAKRAVRGVPIGTAISEAIGYLWLAVIASAFTPLVLYLAVSMTDAITAAIATGTQQDTNKFLGGFSKALDPASDLGGGPVMLIFVSLLSMAAAAVLWVELLVRAAMLYVGAILGTAVYSGLVDKAMWHHVRRWAGIMIAVLLAKPVIVIVLGLATAVSTGGKDDAFSAVLSGLAILFLSIFASVLIYRFVPSIGDDMAALHSSRKAMQSSGPASAVNGPATYVKQGIQAHASRGSTGSGAGSAPVTANAVSSGIAAHGTRGGGSGGAPAPTPAQPPTASPAATPHARNGKE